MAIPRTPGAIVSVLLLTWWLVAPVACYWSDRKHHMVGPWAVFNPSPRHGCRVSFPFMAQVIRAPDGLHVVFDEDDGDPTTPEEPRVEGDVIAFADWGTHRGAIGLLAPVESYDSQIVWLQLPDQNVGDRSEARRLYVAALGQRFPTMFSSPTHLAAMADHDIVLRRFNTAALLHDLFVPIAGLLLATMLINTRGWLAARLFPDTSRMGALRARRCPCCGYDTSGTPARCPECGEWLTWNGAPPPPPPTSEP